MKNDTVVRKIILVFFASAILLTPLGITTPKVATIAPDQREAGQIKIISINKGAGGISMAWYDDGHIGPLWLPNHPLQFNFHAEPIQFKINGELQNIDLPVWIYLRYYTGIGPSLYSFKHNLGIKSFGACADLAVIPFHWLHQYIQDQPFFNVRDLDELGQTAWGLTSVDFNHDELPDFAVASADAPFTHSTISIYYNNGNDSFTKEDVYTFDYSYITDLQAGDYNNDGHIDLVFTYSEDVWYEGLPILVNGTGKILLNDGTNHFSNPLTIFWNGPGEPYNPENRINPQLTTADYNKDGNLDLLVGDNSGKVEILLNNGTGTFTSAGLIHDYNQLSWGLSSGDFDHDGDVDAIVAANIDSSSGYVYLKRNHYIESNGSTIFDTGSGDVLLGFIGLAGCLQVLDYNNDGLLDFLFGLGDSVYLILDQNSSLLVVPIGRLPENKEGGWSDDLSQGALTSSDYNRDGKADFVVGGVQGIVRLGLNNYSLALPPTRSSINHPPKVIKGEDTEFTFVADDILGANVSYWIDWGDGTNSGWIGPYASGEEIALSHTWAKALTYFARVKAKNAFGESDWQNAPVFVYSKNDINQRVSTPLVQKYDDFFLYIMPKMNNRLVEMISETTVQNLSIIVAPHGIIHNR